MRTVLQGAKVFTNGSFERLDVIIDNGRIVSLNNASDGLAGHGGSVVFDFSNKYIFPGFVDVHVHLREPGFSYKEDIYTGSLAAAHGGYTDICPMPNLSPVPDADETLKQEEQAIKEKAVINVYPYGSITRGSMGEELAELEVMADRVIGFSDDGKGVAGDELMREAFVKAKALNKIISAHCEFKHLMKGAHVHDGAAAAALGIQGITSESEWAMIDRDIKLAKELGATYHVCHVSTKESIDIIRKAKAEGVDVTCETGPHYLLLDENAICDYLDGLKGREMDERGRIPADFKMNPPLRSPEDRVALIEALKDGTLDMIATDHAPHSAEEKAAGILKAPMGIVGIETSFALLYTGLVKTGVITLEKLVAMMSTIPASRFGIECGVSVGSPAKLTVFDLDTEYIINPENFLSKGRSTPFKGERVYGKCLMTVCNGEIVYRRKEID